MIWSIHKLKLYNIDTPFDILVVLFVWLSCLFGCLVWHFCFLWLEYRTVVLSFHWKLFISFKQHIVLNNQSSPLFLVICLLLINHIYGIMKMISRHLYIVFYKFVLRWHECTRICYTLYALLDSTSKKGSYTESTMSTCLHMVCLNRTM